MRTLAYIAIILLIVSFVETRKKPKKCKGLDKKKYLVGKGYEENCKKYICRRAQSKRKRPKMLQTTSTSCCKEQGSEKLIKCAHNPYQGSILPDNSTMGIKTPTCMTTDGNMTGVLCTFPFIYNGTRYMGCTLDGVDDGISWCSTKVDKNGYHVKGDDHWGHCNSECPTQPDKSTDDINISYCMTVSGASCAVPFIYNDTAYIGCTLDGADDGLSWCSTNVDNNGYHIKGDNNWGICDKRCPTLTGRFIGHLNITTNGSRVTNFSDRSPGGGYSTIISNIAKFFKEHGEGSWTHPLHDEYTRHGRHCWTDGSGYCPNGNCHDDDGPQGVVIKEERWIKPVCAFIGRPKIKRQTCCSPSLEWRQTDNADCWSNCGNKGGYCPDRCGRSGYCCRKGYGGCPDGAAEASLYYHTCVKRIQGTIYIYKKMEYGKFCSGSWSRITSEAACHAAAADLGLKWAQSWYGPGDFPGCLHTKDHRNSVYFNTSPNPSNNPNVNANYAEICQAESQTGYLNSPNYPDIYSNNQHVVQRMTVGTGRIHVTFLEFKLEYGGSTCPYDYVQFCDLYGRCNSKMCGKNLRRDFILETSTVNVVFHSDWIVTSKGFVISYRGVSGKPSAPTIRARSSSVLSNDIWGPHFAIDGYTSSTYQFFFHSATEDYPWLQIKLSYIAQVSSVKIVNRKDCCVERLKNVEIRAGMSGSVGTTTQLLTSNAVCATFQGPASSTEDINLTCQQQILSRFITIQLKAEKATLQINELKAYGPG